MSNTAEAWTQFSTKYEKELPGDIVKYFVKTYVGVQGSGRNGRGRVDPMYPHELWNVYDRTLNGIPRTTNSVEAFHSAFNNSVTNANPTIWKLLDGLHQEDSLGKLKLGQHHSGEPEDKKEQREQKERRLQNLLKSYNPNDKLKFITAVSKNINY